MAQITRNAGLGQSIYWSGGLTHWTTPTYIYTSNNTYANVRLYEADDNVSHYLRATTFGFTIPGGATIDGIKVEFEKKSSEYPDMWDESVKIVKAGSEQGTQKATSADWPLTDTYISYGGASDKWGLTWTPAQINASNFGVSIAAVYYGYEESSRAYVDHVRITVYYTVTGTNMKINIGDSWKEVTEIKINIGDSWKTVTKAQINIGDVWKTIFG